jgi:hypothetical protein
MFTITSNQGLTYPSSLVTLARQNYTVDTFQPLLRQLYPRLVTHVNLNKK